MEEKRNIITPREKMRMLFSQEQKHRKDLNDNNPPTYVTNNNNNNNNNNETVLMKGWEFARDSVVVPSIVIP